MEHHLLKLELAIAVRAAGWQADLEVTRPGASWRVDVMATSPDGAAVMAWEAQVSTIATEEIVGRTRRLSADRIPVCWIAAPRRPWVGMVPSIVAEAPSRRGEPWTVTAGLFRFDHDWVRVRASLPRFIGWVLSGQVIAYADPCAPLLGGHNIAARWHGVWTAPRYARAAAASETARVADRRARQAAAQREVGSRAWIEAAKQRIAAAEREETAQRKPG